MRIKRLFAFFLFPLLCFYPAFSAPAFEVGAQAPDFELKNLQGNRVRLSDFAGRPIILKLATTWCPTCRLMTDELVEIAPQLARRQVVLVEVFVQDSQTMVERYFKGRSFKGLDHVVLLDDGRVAKAYDVYLVPRTLFLDADLKVARDAGLIQGRDIVRQIERMTQ